MTQVGLYARISEDPNDTRAGVERQREDGLRIAELRGWTVAQEYVDNDLSAYKRKVKRPEFERLLADLASGSIDGIVVYDLDRFVRQPRDLERAIDIYDDRKGLVFASAQGDINLQSADGLTMARVMVAFANKSSMDTARRVARKHLEIAKTGRPVGGFRPFGWQEDKATLEPTEAQLVRDAVELIVAGGTLRGVCRAWTEMGLLTTAGKEWRPATIRQYLRNPRLVGYRTHQRKVLLDDHGKPVQGLWEPLLTVDQWERVVQVLERPEKRSRVPRRGARHYFLTGIVRCLGPDGRCNSPMYGNRYATDRHYYSCNDNGHSVTVSGVGTDEAVRDLILAKLADLEAETPAEEWEGEGRLAELLEQIDTIMEAFMGKVLSAEVAFPRIQRLEEDVAEMQKGRSQWLEETTGPAVRRLTLEQWKALDTDEQRAYAEKVLVAVMVKPATQRGNRFDHDRLVPVWKKRGEQPALAAVHS